MVGDDGPFKVVGLKGDGEIEDPINPPLRRYSCPNYTTCLNITAALNWDSFTCSGCSGEINEALNWQAHIAQKRDGVADRICKIPPLDHDEAEENQEKILHVVGEE